MFFRKKKPEKVMDWYCVGIYYPDDTDEDDDENDERSDMLMDIGNVGVVTNMSICRLHGEDGVALKKIVPELYYDRTSYVVLKIDSERIAEATKKMENEKKWKKFFDLISLSEYLDVEHDAMYDFDYLLLYTDDLQEVIEFLSLEKQKNNMIIG
ncbi:hypothetical protein [Bacillus massilinigeriensis]|uniref:hypothetical protein n=1 Tax=Bacillus mediterraneensis TaxID=1805474 RepID=UPI0008F900A2|nr:hypothetical protein [Bacillus mediterraneensis]